MANLSFYYGTMNCGKSTLALQKHYNATKAGQNVLFLTRLGRDHARVTSRIGISHDAIEIEDDMDIYVHVVKNGPFDLIVGDEAQFYSPEQAEQLADVADVLNIEVVMFGLLTDFSRTMFTGTKRFLELADMNEKIQFGAICWCGQPGTHNARIVNGTMAVEGEQVVVGDIDGDDTRYVVLCRRHHRTLQPQQ